MSKHTAAEVRAGLGHPVVDADGHWMEHYPVMMDASAPHRWGCGCGGVRPLR